MSDIVCGQLGLLGYVMHCGFGIILIGIHMNCFDDVYMLSVKWRLSKESFLCTKEVLK